MAEGELSRELEADLGDVAGKTHKGACTCKDPDRCKCKKSSFGPQSLSNKQTFPRTVFGSSLRDNGSKVKLSCYRGASAVAAVSLVNHNC